MSVLLSIKPKYVELIKSGSKKYEFRKKRRDPFLLGILSGSRTMIIGDEEDLIG